MAAAFSTDSDFFSMTGASRTCSRQAAAIEVYPEEGHYHLDGGRKCAARLPLPQIIGEILGAARWSQES